MVLTRSPLLEVRITTAAESAATLPVPQGKLLWDGHIRPRLQMLRGCLNVRTLWVYGRALGGGCSETVEMLGVAYLPKPASALTILELS